MACAGWPLWAVGVYCTASVVYWMASPGLRSQPDGVSRPLDLPKWPQQAFGACRIPSVGLRIIPDGSSTLSEYTG